MNPTIMQRKLADAGYYCGPHLAAEISLLLAQDIGVIKAMLLDGPPGSGKTLLAKSVAQVLGIPYIYIQAHAGSSPEDFLMDANIVTILKAAAGDKDAVKSAKDVVSLGFVPTIFSASQHSKVVAFVDELDKSSPKVDAFFLTALQEGEVVIRGLGIIKANLDNLILFFTKNNEREVSEALMRRCRRAYLSFPSPEMEINILINAGVQKAVASVLVNLASQLRGKKDDMIKVPTTQELIIAGQDVSRLNNWNAMALSGPVVAQWLAAYQEDMAIFLKVIQVDALTKALTAAAKSDTCHHSSTKLKQVGEDFVSYGK